MTMSFWRKCHMSNHFLLWGFFSFNVLDSGSHEHNRLSNLAREERFGQNVREKLVFNERKKDVPWVFKLRDSRSTGLENTLLQSIVT